MIITSKDNELFKTAIKLKQKKYREKLGLCLVEGKKIVDELQCEHIFIANVNISEKLFKELTNTECVAICKIPSQKHQKTDRFIVCDNIQNAGNMGTICRTALAFGFNTVYSINSADAFSEKVIRASVGAVFKLNIVDISLTDFLRLGLKFYVADMHGKKDFKNLNKNFGLVLGSEGQGVCNELKNAGELIAIPMKNVESLNVAAAASIIMWELIK